MKDKKNDNEKEKENAKIFLKAMADIGRVFGNEGLEQIANTYLKVYYGEKAKKEKLSLGEQKNGGK